LFGQGEFPRIGQLPYLLTLGPYAFYWFAIRHPAPLRVEAAGEGAAGADGKVALSVIEVHGAWDEVFSGAACRRLERLLPGFLRSRRWFGGKARAVRGVDVWDIVHMCSTKTHCSVGLLLLRVEYTEGEPEGYLVPIAFGDEAQLRSAESPGPAAIICRLEVEKGGARTTGVLYDAFGDEGLSRLLLEMLASRRRFHGKKGTLVGRPTRGFHRMMLKAAEPLKIVASKADQSNSTVFYGDQFLLKLFRRLEEGVNPELEIESFLTETLAFPHAPPLAGAIEYLLPRRAAVTVCVLEGFVHNQGNAWSYTTEAVERYFESVVAQQPLSKPPDELLPREPLVKLAAQPIPGLAESMFGTYLESAALLGRRTAEMHVALAGETDLPHFGQEAFSQFYQRSLYQAVRNLAARTFSMLRRSLANVPADIESQGEAVAAREGQVFERLRPIVKRRIDATRIRCHGDYHLGQVLYTGSDFVIVDFEGEPARSISERQLRASPFRDVAGMLRSFDYACYSALADRITGTVLGPEESTALHGWMRFWTAWTSAAFLKSYLATAAGQPFVPQQQENTQLLLDVYLLEKSFYELRYELNNRPDWARIPLHGIMQLLDEPMLATSA
jgi:maltose alpha-D-glucosyltransferase/alpha-amylase